jgi:hypothetical protein
VRRINHVSLEHHCSLYPPNVLILWLTLTIVFSSIRRGAKVLKASSKWKKRGHIPQSKTRKPLEASFSNTCGALVTLKGSNLHGDEQRYGPEHDDSVGLYREFMLDDFEDTHDNITFSSNHEGCALIELESRYAPLIPAGKNRSWLCFSSSKFSDGHFITSFLFKTAKQI